MLCTLKIGFITDDDAHTAILALLENHDVYPALERIELESLGYLDELESLRLGEIRGKTKSLEIIKDGLLLDVGDGKNIPRTIFWAW